MIEYYGWLNISESLNGDNEDNIVTIVKEIESKIPPELMKNKIFDLKAINGSFVLSCSGITNRYNSEIDFILALFNNIAVKAIGTYGLLYIRNSDNNYFDIIKISKGKVVTIQDTILSPCVPEIEE